jgi:hypothetical protein
MPKKRHGMGGTMGTYGKNKSIQVSNLPGQQDLMIQVRSLGTLFRKSAWSEAVEAFAS